MITLTLYLYFSLTGEVEWSNDMALYLGAFDLLMIMFLSDITLVEVNQ